jgi:ribonuclease D
MISKDEVDTALAAALHPIMVETAAQLEQAIETWMECSVIGIDTEFVRETTWRAALGLVQLSDGKKVWLVDPLKTGPLQMLSALFEDPSITKILHSPSEDLDVLLYTTGAVPSPLFDTQTACAMLGESLQMGYHNTVDWLLNLTIDKGETRSNWLKRPLRPAQLHYAALDVCLLPMMHRQLMSRLEDIDRNEWLNEDCNRLLNKAQTVPDPELTWKRIAGHNRLNGSELAILQALATWRDKAAERRNLARGFVIKDRSLMTIATQQPDSLDALSALDVWHPKAILRNGHSLIAIIDRIVESGQTAAAPAMLQPEHKKLMGDMRSWVQQKATELSIEPALLASKRELEGLILTPQGEPVPERFLGWRNDVITHRLVELKDAFNG